MAFGEGCVAATSAAPALGTFTASGEALPPAGLWLEEGSGSAVLVRSESSKDVMYWYRRVAYDCAIPVIFVVSSMPCWAGSE